MKQWLCVGLSVMTVWLVVCNQGAAQEWTVKALGREEGQVDYQQQILLE